MLLWTWKPFNERAIYLNTSCYIDRPLVLAIIDMIIARFVVGFGLGDELASDSEEYEGTVVSGRIYTRASKSYSFVLPFISRASFVRKSRPCGSAAFAKTCR